MAGALLVRLPGGHHADVVQELVPEPAVQQMQRGVLHAAVVPVHRAPVFQRLPAGQRVVVVRVHIAQEVPGRARPLGHGVRLPFGGAAAARAGGVHPFGMACQRAFAVAGGLKILDLRQHQRQLALRQRHPAAFFAIHHRDRLAPIALAAEHPIPQLEVCLGRAQALFGQPFGDGLFRLVHAHAVQKAAVHHHARGTIGESLLRHIAALDDLDDGQIEFFREIIVALVVGGHGHDGARAVADEHIVGDEDGDLFAVHGVHGAHALQPYACFVLCKLGALEVALLRSGLLVFPHGVQVGDLVRPFFNAGMLGRDDHISRAKQRVRAGGVDEQLVAQPWWRPFPPRRGCGRSSSSAASPRGR